MRTKFLFSIAIALFATSFSTLYAQTEGKKHEIGIQFSGLNFNGFNSFNALYRKQKSENVYRRIRATVGNINFQSNSDANVLLFNAGMSIGREKRKSLDSKLEFYRGPEVSFGLGFITGDVNNKGVSVNAAFGYILGLQHSFSELWAINLETVPSIGAVYNAREDSDNDSLAFDARFSSAVSLGVVRKF